MIIYESLVIFMRKSHRIYKQVFFKKKGGIIVPSYIYFDAWDTCCKTPFGAAKENQTISLFLKVSSEMSLIKPIFILRADNGEEILRKDCFPYSTGVNFITYHTSFSVETRGLYFYRFEIVTDTGVLFVGRGEDQIAKIGNFLSEWQLGVYDADFKGSEFVHQGIMYQIFPDRFYRPEGTTFAITRNQRTIHSDINEYPDSPKNTFPYAAADFYGGTLNGILEKLPYLKNLGITILYLNPIFESCSNHRYDTADYFKIDPYLGVTEDFENLCAEAKKLGMGIILDGVFSHTGADSIYFNKDGHYSSSGAYQSADSPYSKWYTFSDNRKTYDCWWGFDNMPNTNETENSYMNFICGDEGVLHYWLNKGASGWRFDVADELPDEFLMQAKLSIKSKKKDAYVLGEVWEDASNKISYGNRRPYLWGDELDGVMNYPWRSAILDLIKTKNTNQFFRSIMTILDHYPKPVINNLMTPLSTHDTTRAITYLSSSENTEEIYCKLSEQSYQKARHLFMLASIIQYTLPGVPSLYYGDEAGLYGFSDPDNRRFYPWGREDEDLIEFFCQLGKVRHVDNLFFFHKNSDNIMWEYAYNSIQCQRKSNSCQNCIAVYLSHISIFFSTITLANHRLCCLCHTIENTF